MRCPTLDSLPPPPLGKTGWPWTEASPPAPDAVPQGRLWPRVSVVTPSYNQARYLEETIRSVLLQGYPDLEYFVMDGGSTDGSVDVIRRYERWLTGWASEKDRGQADAINKGFARASGAFLSWLNSDDCLYPDAIRTVVSAFAERPDVDFLYGDVAQGAELDGALSPRHGARIGLEEMLRAARVPIPQQGSLCRRTVIERVGGLDSRWQVALDRDWFLRIALKCKMDYLPGRRGFFRIHSECKSVAQKDRWTVELPAMYRRFFARKDLPREIAALRKQAMSSLYVHCAAIARSRGDRGTVRAFVRRAILCDPRVLLRADLESFRSGRQWRLLGALRWAHRKIRGTQGASG